MRFADVRALRTEIAAVTAEMVSKRLDPQSVVVTQEQARALVMVEGAEELRVAAAPRRHVPSARRNSGGQIMNTTVLSEEKRPDGIKVTQSVTEAGDVEVHATFEHHAVLVVKANVPDAVRVASDRVPALLDTLIAGARTRLAP